MATVAELNARNARFALPVQVQADRLVLQDVEVLLALERLLHGDGVKALVALQTDGAHRWTLAGIELAGLDGCYVGDPTHRAAERVDFRDDLGLSGTAHRGIAGHEADPVEVRGDHQRAGAHPRGREGRFGAGMARADDDDVVGVE